MAIALLFAACFLLTFAVAALAMRPSREEKTLNERLQHLLNTGPRSTGGPGSQPLLRQSASKEQGTLVAQLSQLKPVRSLRRLVYQSTHSRSILPTVVWMFALMVASGIAIALTTHLVPLAALVAAVCSALPLYRLHALRQRRVNAFNKSLPDCIDTCARALRAGHSLIAAIGIVAEQAPEPARLEFVDIFQKQNFGLPLREALLETLERVPSADLRVLITGVLVQKDTGGNLTEIFDRLVFVMRERLRIEGEIRIHTAQGRMTAWILTLLPPVLFVIVNLLNPGYSRPMFADSTGRALFYGGVVSLMLGGLTVRHIVNGIEV